MRKIKISHEVPICLLEDSRKFNDYDFCLPHLMDESPEYRDFFLESKKQDRYIIMDNSLHELGEAYDHKRLLHWINELLPDEFIVPDVWGDFNQSVRNAKTWMSMNFPKGVTRVAVVQAKSLGEAVSCAQIYKDLGYEKIAFTYGLPYYESLFPHCSQSFARIFGRITTLNEAYKCGVLTDNDRVHLLGASMPVEFSLYKNQECIESIDTSNPIMATLDGTKYTLEGLNNKPKSSMNENFGIPIEDINLGLLEHNISIFKKITV